MNHNKFKFFIAFCVLGTTFLCAQESVNATGGTGTGTNGNTSFSVGQLMYTTQTGTNGSVAQGVQQSFEISTTLGIEVTNIELNAVVFPNPTTNYVNLQLKELEKSNLKFQVMDISGRVLSAKKITADQTKINMQQLAAATYFISVFKENKIIKTFKIIKK
ncbi:T9SS type A sorting domain-containing protein [Kordia jejudonensis]|uniref:T9SS type A sorting domain-containing protein n=1 Tax=Kordia jejudonensis TaxID=1348245 RepID=UPI0006291B6B|nr:T9SS type A sorting domain-containing protein [Kordia jejudonensis]